ncbi:MAG: hypothetical protein OXF02_04715 [Simkaniaceae bacterium]|nr:hypothetical protein [Simkaniaceae bacterium]
MHEEEMITLLVEALEKEAAKRLPEQGDRRYQHYKEDPSLKHYPVRYLRGNH